MYIVPNNKDRDAKGRTVNIGPPRGSQNPRAKLTEHEVRIIRDLDLPHSVIAKSYGVSASAIGLIKRRVNWSWVA